MQRNYKDPTTNLSWTQKVKKIKCNTNPVYLFTASLRDKKQYNECAVLEDHSSTQFSVFPLSKLLWVKHEELDAWVKSIVQWDWVCHDWRKICFSAVLSSALDRTLKGNICSCFYWMELKDCSVSQGLWREVCWRNLGKRKWGRLAKRQAPTVIKWCFGTS